eukprot:scaffold526223_cov51-Prasinocladus_malaysianus.AAC.2
MQKPAQQTLTARQPAREASKTACIQPPGGASTAGTFLAAGTFLYRATSSGGACMSHPYMQSSVNGLIVHHNKSCRPDDPRCAEIWRKRSN